MKTMATTYLPRLEFRHRGHAKRSHRFFEFVPEYC
jgi:hypothetical protein